MLNDRCYTGSDNLLMLNDDSYSGGRIADLIEKNITANGTYSASDDGADGYSEVNVDVQAKLNPVAFTGATHIEQYRRTITISDYEVVAQIDTETTYCTGVITLPVTNFTKDEFVMEYSITTPSAVGGNYFARCFFSDAVPTNPWTEQENYGYTQLAQSSSDWGGIMQRFEIPSGASYFNIEVGGTSFSSIKLYEEAQPTLISKTITENGTYLAHTDNAYGYSEVDVEVPGGLIITDLIPTPATADSTEPFANTQWDANAAAWHAFDKDISTCWASGNGMAGNWQIGYAFHEPVVVNRVKIINRDDPTWGISQAPQVFWIYGSNDGENWTEVTSGGHIWTGLNEEFIYDFENNDAYSTWKIHTKLSMAGATGNLSLSIIGFYNRTYLPASRDAVNYKTYIKFNGEGIVLPWTIDADYKVEVTFYETEYRNDTAIIGNTNGPSYFHVTEYSNNYFYSKQYNLENHFGPWVSGEHTIIYNDGTGHIQFDGTVVGDCNITSDSNIYLQLGGRGSRTSAQAYYGYIKAFKIYSIANDTLLHELKPATIYGKPCFFDTVETQMYTNSTVTAVDVI